MIVNYLRYLRYLLYSMVDGPCVNSSVFDLELSAQIRRRPLGRFVIFSEGIAFRFAILVESLPIRNDSQRLRPSIS